MEVFLALLIFGQTYADTTWTMYGGTLENTHFQKMVGAMETAPYVKWSYISTNSIGIEARGAAVADVDNDGAMEVVIGSAGSVGQKVYCLDGVTGLVKWSYGTFYGYYSSATIADVDGDMAMEVVIGNYDGKVYCLNGVAGTLKWSYNTGGRANSSPAIVDVDGDGNMEVVTGSINSGVHCLNGVTGAVKWNTGIGSIDYSSPAIADVDGNGNMEVIIGSRNGGVYCLNGVNGLVKWSYATGDEIESSPAVADVDGDGAMEVIIGSDDNKVYCLNGTNGLVKWSYTTGDDVLSSPAVADMDRDGNIEVVIGSNDGKVYCLDGVTGLVEWSYYAGGGIHRGISVADLEGEVSGECNLEVLIPNLSRNYLTCLNGENGSVLWTKQLDSDVHDITIADIDDDGCVELVVGTQNGSKIWALDDVGNRSDCKCDTSSNNIEEKGYPSQNGIEFRSMGKGIYLFTPNAIQVDINVYDVSGSLEQTIYKGILNKGGHTFMPNIKSSGVYFVTLQSRNFKQSLKLIRF